MLLAPTPSGFSLAMKNNNNNKNIAGRSSDSLHHQLQNQLHLGLPRQNGNDISLGCKIAHDQITMNTAQKKESAPRPVPRGRMPPYITICPPDVGGHISRASGYLTEEELDNEVFQSPPPTPASPKAPGSSSYDEKHEVYSGRLYLLKQADSSSSGGNSTPPSPCRSPSPSRSPSRAISTVSSFPFRSSPPVSSSILSGSPPPASPSSKRKMSVFVRVYRYNTEHFAIVTRDVIYTSKPVYINMRHSRVLPGDCLGRFIVVGKCDSGNVIEFETPDISSLENWLDAFQTFTPPSSPSRILAGGSSGGQGSAGSGVPNTNSAPIPRSPALPTLEETDEED